MSLGWGTDNGRTEGRSQKSLPTEIDYLYHPKTHQPLDI